MRTSPIFAALTLYTPVGKMGGRPPASEPSMSRHRDDDYDDDEDDYDDRRPRRSRRRRGFHCPFCRSDEPPDVRQQISPVGWALFGTTSGVLFLLGFFTCITFFLVPLGALFLLMKEDIPVCYECRMRVGRW